MSPFITKGGFIRKNLSIYNKRKNPPIDRDKILFLQFLIFHKMRVLGAVHYFMIGLPEIKGFCCNARPLLARLIRFMHADTTLGLFSVILRKIWSRGENEKRLFPHQQKPRGVRSHRVRRMMKN